MYVPFWVSVSLCRSVYCLRVDVYCTTATGVNPISVKNYTNLIKNFYLSLNNMF